MLNCSCIIYIMCIFIKIILVEFESYLKLCHIIHHKSWRYWKLNQERGLDIRLELLTFYEIYSANIMHLVIFGKGKYYRLVNFGTRKAICY
jgi:hypothetical protein